VTKWSDSLCGAKTAGLILKCKTLLPREKSRPLIKMITELGSLERETHHGGRCRDERSYQAGVISLPPTNFTAIDEYINM
jgi:hypothetical protein